MRPITRSLSIALHKNIGLKSEKHYISDAYKSLFFNRKNTDLNIELKPNRIHASNLGNNIRILMVPQPEDKLNGVVIFPSENNPFESLSSKEEVFSFFQENFLLLLT